jgi:hypothetical protein
LRIYDKELPLRMNGAGMIIIVNKLSTDGVQGLPCNNSQQLANTSKASLALPE